MKERMFRLLQIGEKITEGDELFNCQRWNLIYGDFGFVSLGSYPIRREIDLITREDIIPKTKADKILDAVLSALANIPITHTQYSFMKLNIMEILK